MTRSIDRPVRDLAGTEAPDAARWLALATAAGAALFTLAWFVLGFFASDYEIDGSHVETSVLSQPISGLGMGTTAPYMNAAFILSGLLIGAGVLGVFRVAGTGGRPGLRRACVALLALSGVGLVLAGAFDISRDLPHLLGFALSVGLPVVSFLLAGRFFMAIPRWRGLGVGLLVASPVALLLVTLFQIGFDQDGIAEGEGMAGLFSRIMATWVLGWFGAMGWLTFRRPPGVPY